MPNRLRLATALLFSLALITAQAAHANDAELRQALAPHTVHLKLKTDDWQALARQEVVTRELPGSHAKEMAGFGALTVEAAPEEIAAAFRSLAAFKHSPNTLACGRFSQTPLLDDFAGLKLKDKDVLELIRAKVKDAGIKLSAADIARLQAVAGPNPGFSQRLIDKLTIEYKQLLLSKAQTYLKQGGAALSDYADQEEPVNAGESLRRMLNYQFSQAQTGNSNTQSNTSLHARLTSYPQSESDSFIYWASQKFGQLKPVISLVHVAIHREGNRTFIASQQIYASHYTEAGLSIAELIPYADAQGKPHTLIAYTIRLQVDLLGGSTGFMKRRMAQPRMLETLKESLLGLRRYTETARNVVAL